MYVKHNFTIINLKEHNCDADFGKCFFVVFPTFLLNRIYPAPYTKDAK